MLGSFSPKCCCNVVALFTSVLYVRFSGAFVYITPPVLSLLGFVFVFFFFSLCWKSITYYSNDLAFFSRCSNRGGRCPSEFFFIQLHFSVSSTCELLLKIRNNDLFLPWANWNLLERAKKGTRSFDLRRPRYSFLEGGENLEGEVIQFIHVSFQWRKWSWSFSWSSKVLKF